MTTETSPIQEDVFNYPGNGTLFEGVLSRRVFAYIMDLIIVMVLTFVASFVLIITTFGFGLLLISMVFPVVAALYVAFTVGGPRSSTLGMRSLGLEVRMVDGRRPYALIAIFHALVFYFTISILTPAVLVIGLFSARKRLLHDFASGAIVINSDAVDHDRP
ncbi:MAG: RDD family protein [Pseudomonadota bacterium]